MSATITKIRWKNNANTGGVDAETAYHAIEDVRLAKGGEVSAGDVVEAAATCSHPLHPVFEWDDSEAARQHRLTQARSLMRSIEVVYEKSERPAHRVYDVAHFAKRGDKKDATTYRTTEELMADPVARDRLIADAIKQAMAFRRRFKALRELQLIFEAIDQVSEDLVRQ